MTPQGPFILRLLVRLALVAIALLRRAAPASIRARWSEEWHAEIEHAATRLAHRRWATLRLLGFLTGMVPDVANLHRLPRTASFVTMRSPRFRSIGRDFRYAARNLGGAPAFTITVVASLSIGIAAVAGGYAFINAALFPTLPGVTDQHRLVEIMVERGTFDDSHGLLDAVPALGGLSASVQTRFAVGGRGQALSVGGALVSANYFDVLGVRMAAGRRFSAGEDGRADAVVAVVGHALWRRLFDRDPSALGEFITVGGHPIQIVGVASEGFGGIARGGVDAGVTVEIWLPSGAADRVAIPAQGTGGLPLPPNEFPVITYIGRLSASSSINDAVRQAEVAAARVTATRTQGQRSPFTRVRPVAVKGTSGMAVEIAAVMLVPLVVLLIACINAANLLLARGSQRLRETAVRLALGASRWRVVRELLTESVLLALLSAAVTLLLLTWLLSALDSAVPFPMSVDLRVIAFAVAVSLASVTVFGLAPAIRLSAARPDAALGSSRSGDPAPRSRVRQGLVVAQVALSLGLLATGGQLITAVRHLAGVTGARDPSTLLMVSFDLTQFKAAPAVAEAFYSSLLERVERLPGVERAGLARGTALWTFGRGKGESPVIVWLPDAAPRDSQLILGGYAGGDLFEAIGLRLVQGRAFQPADRTGRPRVAIVNRTAAERYFDGAALGRVIRVASRSQGYDASQEVQIVGVIEPALEPDYVRTPEASVPGIYLPARLEHEPALTLYLRARESPSGLMAAIREATDAVDPRVPFSASSTLAEQRYRRQTEDRLAAQGLTVLGMIALALACGGLYGMVSFIVSLRRREIGVRMALGAQPRGIFGLVLKHGMNTALLGAAIGGGIAIVLSGVLRASMHRVPPVDAVAFAMTAALLVTAVLLASLVPARRAARVDPMVVLRDE